MTKFIPPFLRVSTPQGYCNNEIPAKYKHLDAVNRESVRRAACVAAWEIYQPLDKNIPSDAYDRAEEEKTEVEDSYVLASRQVQVNQHDLYSWVEITRGWDRSEWFFIFYADLIADMREDDFVERYWTKQ
jgi:hypothetical protein